MPAFIRVVSLDFSNTNIFQIYQQN